MSEFKWAYSEKANLKEPIDALKQDGWQYADIPTASNFNWLFREITSKLNEINKKVEYMEDQISFFAHYERVDEELVRIINAFNKENPHNPIRTPISVGRDKKELIIERPLFPGKPREA